MKKKIKTSKAPKKANKVVKDIKYEFNIRQLTPHPTAPGRKHFVRVVNDCSTSTLCFLTIEEVNEFLFSFDVENYGLDPSYSGTWIDQIITDVEGELFDLDQLEPSND